MQSKRTPSYLFFLSMLVFVFGACTSAPVQEMSDARQAIQAAHAAGADTLAEDSIRSARSLLQQAEQELDSGHFRKARRTALDARSQAMQAREQAEQRELAAPVSP